MSSWSPERARQTYNLKYWSGGYFDINERGHVVACPLPEREEPSIDLYELSQHVRDAGLSLPVLVRFPDILHHRIQSMCNAFTDAMQDDDYQGQYTAVYPIKVNQQATVIEEILAQGQGQVGLEAGSKPELLAVLALSLPDAIIICNGYKDREYIRLALIGQQLGHRVFIVIEKPSEVGLVIREAHDLGLRPHIGVRVRLASLGEGKWQNTGGEKAKFGLHANQVLEMVDTLRQHDMIDCLQLLHFHMGSQISNIRDIQHGMREACRYYAELNDMGVPIGYMDVGGGLGIDYEGTRSRSFCSINYSLQEYAHNIVHAIWDACEQHGLRHPHIITEAGRAMTAHHAMLMTNVIDVESPLGEIELDAPDADAPTLVHDLWNSLQEIGERSLVEVYHNARHAVQEALQMYIHGVLTLEQRAQVEQLYFRVCRHVLGNMRPANRAHREIVDELHEKLADKYFCNFSLFQSMPDAWAIKQVFPIMPLHRLDEAPVRRVVIQDLTCDSDGRIDSYVDSEGVDSSLPLHAVQPGQPYILGFFLLGAYQEILGDMHNLFGDTDSVNVRINQHGQYELIEDEQGDTVEDVLQYVHIDPQRLLQQYRQKLQAAELDDGLASNYLDELEAGLNGYTYFED